MSLRRFRAGGVLRQPPLKEETIHEELMEMQAKKLVEVNQVMGNANEGVAGRFSV